MFNGILGRPLSFKTETTLRWDPQLILFQIRSVIGFSVTCNWSRWSSEGCSSPFTDSVSIAFKEQFHHACVFHDYCYASPWQWVRCIDYDASFRWFEAFPFPVSIIVSLKHNIHFFKAKKSTQSISTYSWKSKRVRGYLAQPQHTCTVIPHVKTQTYSRFSTTHSTIFSRN